jgi:DNA-binding LacI/PurR family transcriptional regulator
MNHATVRRGLRDLETWGLIEKRPRVGNFVVDRRRSATVHPLGLVLPHWMMQFSVQKPVAGLIIAQVEGTLDAGRYPLTVLTYDREQLWHDAGEFAVSHELEGVLLYPGDDPIHVPGVRRMLDAGTRVVLLDHASSWKELGLFSVTFDEAGALARIVERFAALGHRRIAVVMDRGWMPDRQTEYADRMRSLFREHNLKSADDMMVFPDWDHATGERSCSTLAGIFDSDSPPTAIIAPDESWAQGIYRFCYRRRIRVPEDLSVAALQNLTPHAHPIPLSAPDSVMLMKRRIQLAVEHLHLLLDGQSSAPRNIVLPGEIEWTESVGPALGSLDVLPGIYEAISER